MSAILKSGLPTDTNSPRDGCPHVGVCYLIVDLRLLGAHAGFPRIHLRLLRGEGFVLLGQGVVLRRDLFFGGGKLFFGHLYLVVNVVHLLACRGTVAQQFRETLAFALQIGDLLPKRSHLFRQIQFFVGGGLFVGFELSVSGGQLIVVCFQLFAFQHQLPIVDSPHFRAAFEPLAFFDVEILEFTRSFGRDGDFCGLESARGVVILGTIAARTQGEEKSGQT